MMRKEVLYLKDYQTQELNGKPDASNSLKKQATENVVEQVDRYFAKFLDGNYKSSWDEFGSTNFLA